MALSVSRVVRVSVNLSPQAAARRTFGVLMIASDSDVISGIERYRSYLTIEGVAQDFGVDSPAYEAAALYFSQVPKPRQLMVGRYFRTASSGQNNGGVLSASEQLLSNFTVITNGGFAISVNGSSQNVSSLNFSGATNLNGVADIITAGLTGASAEWTGSQFVIKSDLTGAGAKASGSITMSSNPSPGARASGTITLNANPANGNTVTIRGTAVTFVSGAPGANQVQIGVDADTTAANLQTFLAASSDVNLALMTYSTIGAVTTMTARAYGTAGNAYTLAKVGTDIAVSGATLSGGVAADTLTVNGTALTFVASGPIGNQVLVGPTAAMTASNLQGVLQASADSNISQATYATTDNVTTATFKLTGTGGNSFTLAKSSSAITLSGATLTGGVVASSVGYATAGSGTDISSKLKLTEPLSAGLIGGYNAETPAACAAALADATGAWYGISFAASVQPTDDQSMDVSAFIEASTLKRIYGVTVSNTNVLSSAISTDLASRMKAAGYRQSFCQYSSSSPYAVASMFGRAFSVNFNANRSTLTLMFKQEPGVSAEALTETQADVLKAKRCNVFVAYDNDTAIIQYGTMSGPAYFDEVHGLDWLQNAVQTNCYNLLYTSKTKIPQTDAGVNQLTNAVTAAMNEAVNNGLVGPGIWSADGFGQLEQGQYLKNGYYVYAQPLSLQSQSDREARIAPPIQVAAKLQGAIQEVDVLIDVNR